MVRIVGIVVLYNCIAYINDCIFSDNAVETSGDAIHIENGKHIKISNSHFIKNVAYDSGASIVIEISIASIVSCVFQSESVSICFIGSLCVLDHTSVTVTNSQFSNCTAHEGGSTSIIHQSRLDINASDILNFSGCEGAGALYVGHMSTLNATNISVQSSKSKYGGGIYCTEESSITALGSNFTFNTASATHGGALYLDNCVVHLTNTSFYDNIAQDRNGGIYADSASPDLENTRGIRNTAARSLGGIIFLIFSSLLEMSNNSDHYGSSIAMPNKSKVTLDIVKLYIVPNVNHCSIMVNGSSKLVLQYHAGDGSEIPTDVSHGNFNKSIIRSDVCEDSSRIQDNSSRIQDSSSRIQGKI